MLTAPDTKPGAVNGRIHQFDDSDTMPIGTEKASGGSAAASHAHTTGDRPVGAEVPTRYPKRQGRGKEMHANGCPFQTPPTARNGAL